ncbi:hypothetical protein A3G55_03470 [Candidatus Giovannonibacteria bacterium RIFCSPLOWO2_12_FULL_44_25]|uniref:Uncharacterized protein n=2 Tax=Candidatus Giovannoniibacteriota TaxID=1752738 RepID=A0A1F5WCP2_9BACT|nr:MAG: hypothetical protein UW15_C0016G0003 [Parcubacteria group bacterium GW2011_GWC1_44_10]KKT59725.1 MAG: hypothetical protein UW53_C0008G0008 [Candidatus Giovannonibacteria bacterium GW2011_GWA1_44_25]KKU29603.1 MAG: hypothetical protein UX43_C0008G0008 [Candidatus Giovannonibacteria bacterium GW2011_GWB1_46_20]OGF50313.1 MAG: hypothetical protein A2120_01940 [Candidatus Giovannonibacteria bacterium GWA2_45_15]OGF60119.1 MAG: hypothetical protein A2W40_00805 [Candidatus Giovannonibacteria 
MAKAKKAKRVKGKNPNVAPKKRVDWSKAPKEFLVSIRELPWNEILDAIEKKTGVRPSRRSAYYAFHKARISLPYHKENRPVNEKKEMENGELIPAKPRNKKKNGISEEEKKILEILAQEPLGLPMQLLAEKTGVGKREIVKKIQKLKTLLDEKGFFLSVNESKKTVNVARKGFENIEPKIIEIKVSPEEYIKCGANVGVFAGPFYGSEGYRDGLIELNAYVQKVHAVHFLSLLGLVDGRDLEEQAKVRAGSRSKNKEYQYWENLFISQIARELSFCLPKIKKPDGSLVKTYISTSPKVDKNIGEGIALLLSELRNEDIVYFGSKNNHPLIVKYIGDEGKTLLPITIQKSYLPAQYASTKIQGQHRKLLKIHKASDILVFGGYGVFVHKPAVGEKSRPYIGLPTLHAISEQETRNDSESEIGTRTIKWRPDGNYTVTSSDFKWLLRQERDLIKAPPSANETQKKIISVLKERATFIGVLADRLGVSRDEIKKTIEELGYFRAGIVYDKTSRLFDFSNEWFQKKIRYTWPENFAEEAIVSLACLHALATYPADGRILTDCKFLLDRVPNYILETRATALVIAGDLIQGSKVHNLHLRGEVFQGLGLTVQERVSAYLVGQMMIRPFRVWFAEFMQDKKPESLTKETLIAAFERCLVTLGFCAGNHDLWQTGDAVRALWTFQQDLVWFLMQEISKTLQTYSLSMDFLTLAAFLSLKIIRDWPDGQIRYRTPAGIAVKIVHPHTARTETASIPPEKLLSQHSLAQYVISGNWHTAFDMQQSDEFMGLRHIVTNPTVLLRTFFEDNKMKRTDFGVNVSWLRSYQGRIYETESGFWGDKITDEYTRENNARMEEILHEIGEDIFSSKYGKKAVEEVKAPQ